MWADVALALGIGFTVAHVAADLMKLREHAQHPRDWAVVVGSALLIGHVVFTGELARWWRVFT